VDFDETPATATTPRVVPNTPAGGGFALLLGSRRAICEESPEIPTTPEEKDDVPSTPWSRADVPTTPAGASAN
jgi:hypothetical protein